MSASLNQAVVPFAILTSTAGNSYSVPLKSVTQMSIAIKFMSLLNSCAHVLVHYSDPRLLGPIPSHPAVQYHGLQVRPTVAPGSSPTRRFLRARRALSFDTPQRACITKSRLFPTSVTISCNLRAAPSVFCHLSLSLSLHLIGLLRVVVDLAVSVQFFRPLLTHLHATFGLVLSCCFFLAIFARLPVHFPGHRIFTLSCPSFSPSPNNPLSPQATDRVMPQCAWEYSQIKFLVMRARPLHMDVRFRDNSPRFRWVFFFFFFFFFFYFYLLLFSFLTSPLPPPPYTHTIPTPPPFSFTHQIIFKRLMASRIQAITNELVLRAAEARKAKGDTPRVLFEPNARRFDYGSYFLTIEVIRMR